jgi:hypothetical protein
MKVQIDQIGKKEKEHTFQCAQEMENKEHSVELLQNFSQGYEHKAIVELGSTTEGDEYSCKWLENFSQGAEQEITVECGPTTEEEMQQNNLHEGRSQPTEQLDRVIEQIRG